MSEIEARLSPACGFSWLCICGETVSFQIDHPSQVECACRAVYVWDGCGFNIKHWSIRQQWEGDNLVTERVLG